MASISSLLAALDERTIARGVGLRHDEARMQYPLRRNTVATFDEFAHLITDYYIERHKYIRMWRTPCECHSERSEESPMEREPLLRSG